MANQKVIVGQVWRDNDPRSFGRLLKIISVDETHAYIRDGRAGNGRAGRISLKRFRPTMTGYVLESERPATAVED